MSIFKDWIDRELWIGFISRPMNRISSAFTLLAVVLFCFGCATAPKRPSLKELFDRADANGDGKVSRQEFTDYMIEDVFARYDRDGNGYVTQEEYIKGGGTLKNFLKINRSGTGKITLEEAKASKLIRDAMAGPFDEADLDGNGSVSWEEFQIYLEAARPYTRGS